MKPMRPSAILTATLIASLACLTSLPAKAQIAAASLVGTWSVDLRPTPTSPPYLKTLVISAVDGNQLSGHFYDGSPLQAGRLNLVSAATPVFAFFTDPGEGVYQSAGRWVAPDRLEGMTLSTTRGFLLPWVATRDVTK